MISTTTTSTVASDLAALHGAVPACWTDHLADQLHKAFPASSLAADLGDTSPAAPADLRVFIRRLVRITGTTLPTLAVADVYLAQFLAALQGSRAQCRRDTPHRVFLAALLLATKMSDDPPVLPSGSSVASTDSASSSGSLSAASAATLAAICGVYSARDILTMERVFIKTLSHRLWCPPARLLAHVEAVCDAHAVLARAGGDALARLLRL
ncbi:PHO85 cyclin-1 [Blastocladiella emersonii ATCC 22665]|nr:PHO85 cyclin-1 [Blastocladiella emersonii ATCC 22665]